MPSSASSRKKGFTLVEMAIVITIISLIMGSIVVGRTMIRQSQIQSVIGDITQFTQAIHSFHDKYYALPGDFAGAQALWGASDPVLATCQTIPAVGTLTCNGDGDGRIQNPSLSTSVNEEFRAWQHLANAGMIAGKYSGVNGFDTSTTTGIGRNVPASQIAGAGYRITSLYAGEVSFDTSNYFSGINYRHMIQLAGILPSVLGCGGFCFRPASLFGGILSSDEALLIDTKSDDGRPGTGKIISLQKDASSTNCTTSDTANSATYDITQNELKCSLAFLLDF